jgi:DeoR/GlpR family transcriptional regulator of sugar metabolism
MVDITMNDRMNAHQRRELIIRHIRERGRIQVAELMDEFGLTDTSIRRDLSILESKGVIRRVHGGAVSTSEGLHIALLAERKIHFEAQKRRIGAIAAEYIQPRDVLLMDTGTSVLQVARNIPESIRHQGTLRIATNSTLLLDEIGSWATPNLLLLGGIFLPEHWATVGPEVLTSLQQITANRAFLGCDGLTLNGGITSAHPLIAQTGREMANRAEQVIVLADHSKLGRAGFVPIMPIDKIDILITDSSATEQMIESLRERDIQVVVVSVQD